MKDLKFWKGLKFPDTYLIRFFFKEVLQNMKGGNVIEFGCGSGNNLYLFNIYGFYTAGIDINPINIQNAKENFEKILKAEKNSYEFIAGNMLDENILKNLNKTFDILLLPNIIYYITKTDLYKFLNFLPKYLSSNFLFFLRFRTPRDGRASALVFEKEVAFLKSDITNEKGTVQTFYEEYEMVEILKEFFKIKKLKLFHIYEEWEARDRKIFNSDIIIWGEASKKI